MQRDAETDVRADDDDRDGLEDARDKARGPQQPTQQAPQGHRSTRVAQAARARLIAFVHLGTTHVHLLSTFLLLAYFILYSFLTNQ